jgi:hypothetical protein
MAQIDPEAQRQAVAASALQPKYGTPVDRESAYEKLAARLAPEPAGAAAPAPVEPTSPAKPAERPHASRGSRDEPSAGGVVAEVLGSSAFKSFTRSAASALGREISRSIFGVAKRKR